VSRRYGSWLAPYSQRHTFLIDPAGVVRARWVAVRPLNHSREVLEELRRRRQPLSRSDGGDLPLPSEPTQAGG
jgi:peroxiredoxin